MRLLRAAARTMLASYFVVSGVKAFRNPEPLVPLAEPLAEKIMPVVKEYAPAQIVGYVPEDPKTLVQITGAVQVLGGLALATGTGRRFGALLLAASLIPSTLAKYPFWSESDPETKAEKKNQFLKNVSLLGGALLASRDTEGRPGIVWRAEHGGQELAADTRKVAQKLSKQVREEAPQQVKAAKKLAAAQAEAAKKAAKKARKRGRQQLRKVKKQTKRLREHLVLGEN